MDLVYFWMISCKKVHCKMFKEWESDIMIMLVNVSSSLGKSLLVFCEFDIRCTKETWHMS